MIFLKDPATTVDVPFDWTDSVGNGIALTSVAHTVPSGLTKMQEATDASNSLSSVRISGGTNGVLYVVKAIATLTSGELVTKEAPVRVVVA